MMHVIQQATRLVSSKAVATSRLQSLLSGSWTCAQLRLPCIEDLGTGCLHLRQADNVGSLTTSVRYLPPRTPSTALWSISGQVASSHQGSWQGAKNPGGVQDYYNQASLQGPGSNTVFTCSAELRGHRPAQMGIRRRP